MSTTASGQPKWGRVLICGGTDWSRLGRKDRVKSDENEQGSPDLLEPHILRSLSNVKVTSIHTSHSGCNFVAIDIDGSAWLFGRYTSSTGGGPGSKTQETVISENAPKKLRAHEDLGARKNTRFVHAACGRNHSLLVGNDGTVWSMGMNTLGQCGHPTCPEIPAFKAIEGPWEKNSDKVVKVGAGVTFSVVVTESGKVYTFGSGEKGQLGNGTTGERITTGNKTAYDIEPYPLLVKEIQDKKIVQISCGQQHTIALESTGLVYVWGYNGYCRLGLGNQVDVLKPKAVPQFAGPNEATMGSIVSAGPSNSVVIDKQMMYWMAGKWKNSGEGSSGSPYSTFRYIQDMMGCRMTFVTSGGVTHWGLTYDEDDSIMTVAWGQNAANGELGLGPDMPKSSTKPSKHEPLAGIEVFDIAAGQNTTLILAVSSAKLSDLPRHPEDLESSEVCMACREEDKSDEDTSLQCDKCDNPYHLRCLNPPLTAVPEGEWFCLSCEKTPGAPIGVQHATRASVPANSNGKANNSTAAKGTGPPPASKRTTYAKPKKRGRGGDNDDDIDDDDDPDASMGEDDESDGDFNGNEDDGSDYGRRKRRKVVGAVTESRTRSSSKKKA